MKDWQYAIIAGVLAVIIGLQLSIGMLVTGYAATPGDPTDAGDGNQSRVEQRDGPTTGNAAAEFQYGNLSNESQAEVDALINGERMADRPAVVQQAGNETPVVVNGTANATEDATADVYSINNALTPRNDGIFRLGLIGVIGGFVTVYWGIKQREIESLQQDIEEFME